MAVCQWLTVADEPKGPKRGPHAAFVLPPCVSDTNPLRTLPPLGQPITVAEDGHWHRGGSSKKTTMGATWWIRPTVVVQLGIRKKRTEKPAPLSSSPLLPTLTLGVDLQILSIIFPGSTGAGPPTASWGRARSLGRFEYATPAGGRGGPYPRGRISGWGGRPGAARPPTGAGHVGLGGWAAGWGPARGLLGGARRGGACFRGGPPGQFCVGFLGRRTI